MKNSGVSMITMVVIIVIMIILASIAVTSGIDSVNEANQTKLDVEITELKKAAQTKWGDSYSDYAFHKFFLDCGPSDFTSLKNRIKEN